MMSLDNNVLAVLHKSFTFKNYPLVLTIKSTKFVQELKLRIYQVSENK